MAENSAIEKAPELALYEARQTTLLLRGASQEGLQVALDNLVQQGFLGFAALIVDGLGPLRDRRAALMEATSVPGWRPFAVRLLQTLCPGAARAF